ncbi:Pr6Pr family membrane protein [Mycetocola zhujimingii]|uniref:Pr6Pr family membrane protein n=1 Tax=Mycetocola zhujimingii TaxID=2079792 RepID=UPI000D3A285F|nr:Pr6Pr family membrane protein [Mycetocola zhujimingii]AWB85719.1 hypothetical protein C3E77_03205 [Mycetocola zhujimingii]
MRFVLAAVRIVVLAVTVWALLSRTSCFYLYGSCIAINVLSYFTIQSHIIMVVALALSVVCGIAGRTEPQWLTVLRLLATTYVVVSGAVFALLIVDDTLSPFLLQAPMSSKLLHFVLPIYAVGDFIFGTRSRLPWSAIWVSLAFPILWAAYTLVRGRTANWYPYFFLDPDAAGGYGMISIYALVLAIAIVALASLLVASTRTRSRLR